MNTQPAPTPSAPNRSGLTIWTVRLGMPEQLSVSASSLYTFVEGMPGLPDSRRFALIADDAYAPLQWLQSLDEEIVCLPVLSLDVIRDERIERITQELDADGDEHSARQRQRQTVLVMHFDAAAGSFAVNMLAPILLDARDATGRQVILQGQAYPLRQHIVWNPHTRTFYPPC